MRMIPLGSVSLETEKKQLGTVLLLTALTFHMHRVNFEGAFYCHN